MSELAPYVGPALRRIRHTIGFSQDKLAERCGIPKERISRYENNHNVPTLQILERLAEAFETTVSDIIATVEDEKDADD